MSLTQTVQTPQRPLPGAYVATPATRASGAPPARPAFQRAGSSSFNSPIPIPESSPHQALVKTPDAGPLTTNKPSTSEETLGPVERAARTINACLAQELRYPELDVYISQGVSSEYHVSKSNAWVPFQRGKTYPIPDRIFEQYNHAHVITLMGLFADLNHAWVSIDNALYMWDYTQPDPRLIGYEEQSSAITAVQMIRPRPGVFVPSISRVIVVATTTDMFLLGVSVEKGAAGVQTLALYETQMKIPIRGLEVQIIDGCPNSGRIFFATSTDNDIYEMTYQQEERWFSTRCTKINHTTGRLAALTPNFAFGAKGAVESTIAMAVDPTRRLLYVLSSFSTIRVFHLKPDRLDLVIRKPFSEILNHIGHMTSRTELLTTATRIVSIAPISANEASKLHLMAVTSTGCRIFLSATGSYGYSIANANNAPTSMQVHHVKFPPASEPSPTSPVRPASTAPNALPTVNNSSRALEITRRSARYGPGCFFAFVSQAPSADLDRLFVSGPDSGRIARPPDPSHVARYPELGTWFNLNSRAEAVGLVCAPAPAATTPEGYANELATQSETPAIEVAILTNSGIHTLRRQRLVDIYVSSLRNGRAESGLEGTVKKFLRLYGRTETAATSLAVACGQGLDGTADFRSSTITDPSIIDQARTTFIEYGGKPQFNENMLVDQTIPSIDMVRPSPRHDGLALYFSRLVRLFWRAPIIKQTMLPGVGMRVEPTVSLSLLKDVQQDLTLLKEFLEANKSFIDGLAGPEALGRVSTKQQEVALQAEHRALHALVTLISNVIEGISFVQVLFGDRIDEIFLSLSPDVQAQVQSLNFEGLFATARGRDVAKDLVKAIVNRSIQNGANVDTVADALRRQCGSFCSSSDVIIFKAQELLKRAAETGSSTEMGRNLLNESQRLFKQVAEDLSGEQLQAAVEQYISTQFYGGAIELALNVAREVDRGNRALIWIQNGRPENDPGAVAFAKRRRCYDLIHQVIQALDEAPRASDNVSDRDASLATKRRREAYEVIDTSEDEVFQTDLYDWYLERGEGDRLLIIQSPYVITYLKRRFLEDIAIADLLWRHYSQAGSPYDAAAVQLELARSDFALTLDQRIEYLGRARANASLSTYGPTTARRTKLLREISELLDVAGIQADLLQKLREDPRVTDDLKVSFTEQLDHQILPLNRLYNEYTDRAGYFDLSILIYQVSEYQNQTDIMDTWRNLLDATHREALQADSSTTPASSTLSPSPASSTTQTADARPHLQPYEAVGARVRTLGARLNLSPTVFPVPQLLVMLKRYALEHQRGVAPTTWAVDVFLDLQVSPEDLFPVLQSLYYTGEAPFAGARGHAHVAPDILYVCQVWFRQTSRGVGVGVGARAGGWSGLFGSEANADAVRDMLTQMLTHGGLSAQGVEACQVLRMRVEQALR